jgi:hypothetical protein
MPGNFFFVVYILDDFGTKFKTSTLVHMSDYDQIDICENECMPERYNIISPESFRILAEEVDENDCVFISGNNENLRLKSYLAMIASDKNILVICHLPYMSCVKEQLPIPRDSVDFHLTFDLWKMGRDKSCWNLGFTIDGIHPSAIQQIYLQNDLYDYKVNLLWCNKNNRFIVPASLISKTGKNIVPTWLLISHGFRRLHVMAKTKDLSDTIPEFGQLIIWQVMMSRCSDRWGWLVHWIDLRLFCQHFPYG